MTPSGMRVPDRLMLTHRGAPCHGVVPVATAAWINEDNFRRSSRFVAVRWPVIVDESILRLQDALPGGVGENHLVTRVYNDRRHAHVVEGLSMDLALVFRD